MQGFFDQCNPPHGTFEESWYPHPPTIGKCLTPFVKELVNLHSPTLWLHLLYALAYAFALMMTLSLSSLWFFGLTSELEGQHWGWFINSRALFLRLGVCPSVLATMGLFGGTFVVINREVSPHSVFRTLTVLSV